MLLVIDIRCKVVVRPERPWKAVIYFGCLKGFIMLSDSFSSVRLHPGSHRRGSSPSPTSRRRSARPSWSKVALVSAPLLAAVLVGPAFTEAASAAQPSVQLGTAAPFAVLAGTTVTNTGSSVISGDLGVSPGSAVTGFPPGQVNNGTQHITDGVALQAQSDLTTAYNDAAGRTPVNTVSADLGGQTLAPGVYNSASSLGLTGTVTLDAQGDPSAVFVFQAGSTLITAPTSTVALTGGAQACNVFWQVGSSATLDTASTFVGTIMALTSATLDTGATVQGRVLARNGAVTLDTNTITTPTTCAVSSTTTTTAAPTATTTPGGTGGTGGSTGSIVTTTGTTGGGASGTGSAAGVVPTGAPATGLGGAGHSRDGELILLGALALMGSSGMLAITARRRYLLRGSGRLPRSS